MHGFHIAECHLSKGSYFRWHEDMSGGLPNVKRSQMGCSLPYTGPAIPKFPTIWQINGFPFPHRVVRNNILVYLIFIDHRRFDRAVTQWSRSCKLDSIVAIYMLHQEFANLQQWAIKQQEYSRANYNWLCHSTHPYSSTLWTKGLGCCVCQAREIFYWRPHFPGTLQYITCIKGQLFNSFIPWVLWTCGL